MIELKLPYPPTINHYYGNTKFGGKYIKPKGQAFRAKVISQVKPLKLKALTEDISISIDIYPPDKRRRDIDNINKALFDALEHAGVFVNDSQIVEMHSYKKEPCKGGLIIVEINTTGQTTIQK